MQVRVLEKIHDFRIALCKQRSCVRHRAAANGGVTKMGAQGVCGRPSWKSAEIGLFRPLSAFFAFPEGAKSTWEIQDL